jgi:anti-anti-sigma factor
MCDLQYGDEMVARGRSVGIDALNRTRSAPSGREPLDIGAAFDCEGEPTVTFCPDELVRFVYYSRADTALRPGFRMRTTGMHLARLARPVPIREAARRLATLVLGTPLQMVVPGSGNRIRTVTVPATGRGPTQGEEKKEEKTMAEETSGGTAAPTAPSNENPFLRLIVEFNASAMQLEQRNAGEALVVTPLEERLDARVATDFKERMAELIASGNSKIVLDLSKVEFIDSSGLGAIVSSPNNAIRTAADYELIDDPEKWLVFLKERNLTVHVYNEEMAADVVEKVRDFPIFAQKFLGKVKEFCL